MDPAKISLPPLDPGALLRAHGLRPKKSLGQNFLVEDSALRQVVAAASIDPSACVLEIGPGLGHLTRYLASAARRVIAVELDQELIPILQEVLSPFPNVTLIQGDILKQDPAVLVDEGGYLVVANIPYYITSTLIRRLLEAPLKPSRLVLTVQKEVAERICADPGHLSLLALSVQVYGQPQVVIRIPAGAFYPPPEVDSAVLRVDLYDQPRVPAAQIGAFFRLTKAGFSQKRKTLRNALSAGLAWEPARAADLLTSAGIDPQRRAETLSLEEWARLVDLFLKF
jgi:16S rRNA (adenine1518-N6/adenine1519-N6)-dimethyltransferase